MRDDATSWTVDRLIWIRVESVMAYFHCRTWIRTWNWIPVLCGIFLLVWNRTLIEMYNWDRDLSLGWISVPKIGTVTICKRYLNVLNNTMLP